MSKPKVLRAGPLEVRYCNGELRDLWLGQTEVLRRVHGAVRDRNWGTVEPQISDEQIRDNGDSFRVEFAVHNRRDDIDFAWRGTIVGAPDGTVTFEFDGRALRDFWRNRVGLCVLHPINCTGVAARAQSPNGASKATRFPLEIAPHCPFENLRALSHQLAPELWAHVEFEGEIFETEDQRNWTDASFKTYGTPLALPFPVRVAAGERVLQSVTLRFEGDLPAYAPFRMLARVTATGGASLKMPPLGLSFAPETPTLDTSEIELLKELSPSHLRVEVDLSSDFAPALACAIAQARQLDCALEVALFGGEFQDEAALEVAITSLEDVRVVSFCLFASRTQTVAPDAFERVQTRLRLTFAGVPVGAGSNANFAEFNRQRPPKNADFGAYAANPQVHAFDDQSLLETPFALGHTLQSARAIIGGKGVKISPLTLKPRFNAVATAPEIVAPGALPANADARQFTLLGAVWILASIVALLDAGLGTRANDSLTLFETLGPRGVLSAAGMPSPIWFLWRELAKVKTAFALTIDDSNIVGLILGEAVMLANSSAQTRHITLDELDAEWKIGGYEIGVFPTNQPI